MIVPIVLLLVLTGIFVGGYKLHQRSVKSETHSLAWGAEDPPGW